MVSQLLTRFPVETSCNQKLHLYSVLLTDFLCVLQLLNAPSFLLKHSQKQITMAVFEIAYCIQSTAYCMYHIQHVLQT